MKNIPTKFEKNSNKLGNPYYLVLFENRTKLGTALSETVLSGDSLYFSVFFFFFLLPTLIKYCQYVIYMSPLFLKLSSIQKLLILTEKFLVDIKTQCFYSCLILTENFLVNIKTQNFYSCFILTENFSGNIKTQIVFILTENFSDNILIKTRCSI